MDLESRLWTLAGDWIAGSPGCETLTLLSAVAPADVPDDLWTYLSPALTVATESRFRSAAVARSGAAMFEEERQRMAALRIGQALDDRRLPHAFFKGTDLRYRVYPDPHRRDSQDLDLLCSPSDLRSVLATLENLGLKPERSVEALLEARTHETSVRSGDVVVDLHIGPVQPARSRFFADEVLDRRVLTDVPGGRLALPDPVDALALCLIHIGVHEGGREHVAFKHGLDIVLAFRAWPELDIDGLASRTRRWRCSRLAGAGLWTWRRLLGPLVPDHAWERLDPGPLARGVATHARRRRGHDRIRATGIARIGQLGRKLIYSEGWRERSWLLGEFWRRGGSIRTTSVSKES